MRRRRGKFANAFGLYDMHGNVWEWCLDRWHENYVSAPTDESAWLAGDYNAKRPIRGGSYFVNYDYCRSAKRIGFDRDTRFFNIGFRVVYSSS